MASPTPKEELVRLAAEFAEAVKDFDGVDHASHLRLLKQADKLRFLLETPMDVLMKQWEMGQCIAALYFLVQLGVLEAIPKGGSISSEELAEVVKIDESAISKH